MTPPDPCTTMSKARNGTLCPRSGLKLAPMRRRPRRLLASPSLRTAKHRGFCHRQPRPLIPIARSIDLSAPCVGCLPLFHRASQSGRLTSSQRFLSFAWQAFVGRAGLTSAVRTARGHGIIECPGVEAYSCIDFFPSRKRMGLAGSSISAAPEPNPDTLPPADA